MLTPKPLARSIVTRISEWRLRRALSAARNEREVRVLRAVLESSVGEIAPAEQAWMTRIESLRAELQQSQQRISYVDYGASRQGFRAPGGRAVVESVGQICTKRSATRFRHRVLLKLIRHLGPVRCLELGTGLGFSTAYQAAALRLNGVGSLVTLDAAQSFVDIAQRNLALLDLNGVQFVCGSFREALPAVVQQYTDIDFAYIDGDHEEEATVDYFNMVCASTSSRGIIVLDDIRWSPGMQRAWRRIVQAKLVTYTLDLYEMGICIVDGGKPRAQLSVRLFHR